MIAACVAAAAVAGLAAALAAGGGGYARGETTTDRCPSGPCPPPLPPIVFSAAERGPRAGSLFTGVVMSVREPSILHLRIACADGRVRGRRSGGLLRLYYPATTGRYDPSAATCSWQIPASAAGSVFRVGTSWARFSKSGSNGSSMEGFGPASWRVRAR